MRSPPPNRSRALPPDERALLFENLRGSANRPPSHEPHNPRSARRRHRDHWRVPPQSPPRGRCRNRDFSAGNHPRHGGPNHPRSDSPRSDWQPEPAGSVSGGRSEARIQLLRPLPSLVVTLAQMEYDLPHILFGPRNKFRVPPPETGVEVLHGTPRLLHHIRGDGPRNGHRWSRSGIHLRRVSSLTPSLKPSD